MKHSIIPSPQITYTNCSCIIPEDPNLSNTATSGMCPVSCDLFPVYLTIFMIIVLVHSTSEVGSMLLTLRCVEPRDKAMALGLIQCAIGIFGNVPCPVIYGTVVDSACIVWGLSGGQECDNEPLKRGHCWVYDSSRFRVYFHGTTALLMFIAFLIDLVVCYHASAINMGTSPDDDDQEPDKNPNTVSLQQQQQKLQDSSPLLVHKRDLANGDLTS